MDIRTDISLQHNNKLVEAYGDWLDRQIQDDNWDCYYLNLMFKPLSGPMAAIDAQMRNAIVNCFYPRLCKRVERHPGRPGRYDFLPKLILFPDLPVPKVDKKAPKGAMLNGGLHYNGILSISPCARHNEELLEHVEEYHSYYAGDKIQRIHLEAVLGDPHRLMDYAIKTVARGRADYERGIFLPKSLSELRTGPQIDKRTKALKDVQSSTNVSDELAEAMIASQLHRSGLEQTAEGRTST